MKSLTFIALMALASSSSDLAHAQSMPWTTETTDELVSAGNFDGDDFLDILIVDKPLGVVRLGWGRADGSLDWSDVQCLAFENVGSLAVGRMLNASRDSLVVTGPDWNATYLYAGTRDSTWTAQVMSSPVFAPNALAALDVGGPRNNPLLADLFIAGGDFDPATGEVRSASVLPGALILVGQSVLEAPQHHGHAAKLTASGQAATFAAVSPTESILTFWSSLDTAPVPGLPLVTGLPLNADFVQTALGVGQLTLFIFAPGQSVLIRQPLATATTLGVRTFHDLGAPIDFVVSLQTPTLQPRLLVSFDQGTSAAAYSLDGAGNPVRVQTFTPSQGAHFTAAASASGGGALRLLTGSSTSGGTTGWQRWNFTDTGFTPGPSGQAPAVSRAVTRRDVFFFSQEIFVEPTATLLASTKAADWSTRVSIGSPVNATAEQFLNSEQGLGAESTYGLGPRPAGGTFGSPNQYATDISLSRLGGGGPLPPLGRVTFAPSAGTYTTGTLIFLTSPRSDDAVFYRLNGSGPWLTYAQPISLAANALSLEAMARPAGTLQSTPISRAAYLASAPPPLSTSPGLDANRNGLIDSWEGSFGVSDPSADLDGDRFTNKQEHDAGTDPTNPFSFPTGPLVDLPQIVSIAQELGGKIRLIWRGTPLASYAVEMSPDLEIWMSLGTRTASVGSGLFELLDTPPLEAAHRFYRAIRP